MSRRPNILFILADQLRARSLPHFGEEQIATPNLDRLAAEGISLTNAVASCPLCTPYRAMLITGRHPQTTGMIHNSLRIRHDEISIADVFARHGYRTGWIGKWHLHTGAWPARNVPDWVPRGRDRQGFRFWRAYNMHMVYFNGFVQVGDWSYERWEGYETDALLGYAKEFLDDVGPDPFCLFISPHQPHWTPFEFAPARFYEGLPEEPQLPPNVSEDLRGETAGLYRHYLAMTRALDEMVGSTLDYLDRTGRAENTLVVFTSDHGSQIGAHRPAFWDDKRRPYQESVHVPCFARMPGVLEEGATRDCLTAPVDLFPTLCGLCGVPAPPTVEGLDLSDAWRGQPAAREQDAVMTMNFSGAFDALAAGLEWRGVRTKTHSYARWLDGREELYDIRTDPLEADDLASEAGCSDLLDSMRKRLARFQAERGDRLMPAESYRSWFDTQRRVVRNAFGPLGHPEAEPPWSLLD